MSTDSRPIYERIFETLREEILQRKYNIGDRVPSEKELADDYNVSRITSKKALEMLAEVGLIVRNQGKGSFVAEGRRAFCGSIILGETGQTYADRPWSSPISAIRSGQK